MNCLDIQNSRIQRRMDNKQCQKEQPIVEMMKEEIEEQRLRDCVLLDDDEVLSFAAWWKTVDKSERIEVQYPHDRHGKKNLTTPIRDNVTVP